MTVNNRSSFILIVPFFLLVMFLAVRHLGYNLLWYDERVSYYFAGVYDNPHLPLLEIPQRNLSLDRHPFLYYYVLRFWVEATGVTEFTGRTLSLFVGFVGLAWLYRLARDMSRSYAVAFGAVVTMGMSGLYIHHLHEMRFYTILPTFVTMSIWGYWRLSQDRGHGKLASAVLLMGLVGGLYLYFPFAFFAALLGLWHVGVIILRQRGGSQPLPYSSGQAKQKTARRQWRILGLLALAATISFPLYVATYRFSQSRTEPLFYSGAGLNPIEIIGQTIFYLGNNFPLVFLLLFLLSFFLVKDRCFWWITFLGLGLYLVLFLISQIFAEVHNLRNFLILWPMLSIMIGYSIRAQARIPYAVPILILAIVGIGTATNLDMKYLSSFENLAFEDLAVEDQFLLQCSAYSDGFHFTDAALEQNPQWRFDDYGYFLETKEQWPSLLGYYYAGRGIEVNDALNSMPPAERWWIISTEDETVPQLSTEDMSYCGRRNSENGYSFSLYAQDCETAIQQCSFWPTSDTELISKP